MLPLQSRKPGNTLLSQPQVDGHRQQQIRPCKAAHVPEKAQDPSGQKHKSNEQQHYVAETAE